MQSPHRLSPQDSSQKIRQKIKSYIPSMKCAFHQNQSLTNFCSCKKCLLPLCPSCIKIHTIQHINMKNDFHPQYQNLNEMIYELNQDLIDFVGIYNQNFKQISEIQSKIHEFKASIFGNINQLRDDVVNEIQNYFNQVIQQTEQKISSVSYVKNLGVYKQQTKKVLQSLKQIQKNLYSPNHKLMRTLIKYQAGEVQKWLNQFNSNTKSFIDKLDGNFCTLSVRQSFRDSLFVHLGSIYKVEINQITMNKYDQPFSITNQLKQFIQKANEKRQIKKSLSHIISRMSSSKQNQKKDSQSPQKQQIIPYTNNKSIKNKQNQVPISISSSMNIFDQKYNRNGNIQYYRQKDVSLKLFPNERRSFMNHSSEKKQLNLNLNSTQSFCSGDFLNISISQDFAQIQSKDSKLNKQQCLYQNNRRSGSRSRGLSLLHVQHIQNNGNSNFKDLAAKNSICELGGNKKISNRASFLGIQNMNLDFINSRTQYLQRKK